MPDASASVCICNTSPIFYLHQIGRLPLLQALYGTIAITPQVVEELEAGEAMGESIPDVRAFSWIGVQAVRIPAYLDLIPDLGRGEASVLTLALERHPNSLMVMDDKLGRKLAKLRDLRVTGTAGVLLKAKKTGLIPEIGPLLQVLVERGFRLDGGTRNALLELAGEL